MKRPARLKPREGEARRQALERETAREKKAAAKAAAAARRPTRADAWLTRR